MEEVSIIGIDIAKNTFQLHGAGSDGAAIFRKALPRARVLEFLSRLPSCVIAMEACSGAHYWGREISALGHEVRLIAPRYVKPYVKRQKNDAADAEAIAEAASRPSMRFVAVKGEDQQAQAMLLKTRDLLAHHLIYARARNPEMTRCRPFTHATSTREADLQIQIHN